MLKSRAYYFREATIEEPDSVDVYEDATVLRKAVKGWGTDEADLIDVLTHRSYNTRQVQYVKYGVFCMIL